MNESYYAFPPGSLAGSLSGVSHSHHQLTNSSSSSSTPSSIGLSLGHPGLPLMGLPAAVDLSDGSGHNSDREPPDSKVEIDDEQCPVCGDKVSGYHYGLLTCESCKGFFKRTVQNKKVYTCVGERTCQIDKSQRKRCPFCRFQKCLEVGMKLEAVRADRMRGGRNKFGPMYKRDRARKLQAQRVRHHVPNGHSRLSNCKMEGSSSPAGFLMPNIGGPAYDMNNNQAFMKTEMIQIPHLSSTNSPESMHVSGADSNGLPKPWQPSYSPPSNYNQNGSMSQNISLAALNLNSESIESSAHGLPGTMAELQHTLVDDRQWQEELQAVLHSQTYNQCEVDLFELLTKVLDNCLFSMVEWARKTGFFKEELKVEDQMTLLQQSWSEMLIVDFIYHRLRNSLPNETTLANGQTFNLMDLALLGLNSNVEPLHHLTTRLRDLKFDRNDYVCLKFLLLFAPGTLGLNDRLHVQMGQEKIQSLFLEHCLTTHPQVPDRFSQILSLIPEMRTMATQGEDFLYYKHLTGSASTTTLLMELLLARRRL